jgi:hypothetical protein
LDLRQFIQSYRVKPAVFQCRSPGGLSHRFHERTNCANVSHATSQMAVAIECCKNPPRILQMSRNRRGCIRPPLDRGRNCLVRDLQ